MKTKAFLMAALAATMMASCSQDASDDIMVFSDSPAEKAEVTLTFSPYEMTAMTRTATSIADYCTHLDVWIYEGGTEFSSVHQSSSDDGFGGMTVTLDKTKTYTLYAVAHRCAGNAILADGVIAFPDDKVTHSMFYTTTFTPSTSNSLSCEMRRIVAQFSFQTTDACPLDVQAFRFIINNVFDRWNVTTGGTHQLNRISTVNISSTHADGTVGFNIYAIVTDAQTTHDITVESLDADEHVKQSRTFTDVPLRNGYKTVYRGTYFIDTPTNMSFTVDDWLSYDEVSF